LLSIGFALQASLCLLSLTTPLSLPQDTTTPAPLAVPPAIRSARTVFISNAGADSGLFPKPFSGDTDRPYTQFFSALKATGQFDLVSDPSDADLVLELQLLAPTGPSSADKQKGASDPVPEFRLTIYDRKSHYILWTLNESIGVALLQKTHDRNFDDALSALLVDFLQLAGKSVPASASPPHHPSNCRSFPPVC
jgi:hypothetical protein